MFERLYWESAIAQFLQKLVLSVSFPYVLHIWMVEEILEEAAGSERQFL